ncbi:PmoA family protein, partial [bacterium]|nr:PmoA family protein [bacterium]
MKSRYSVEATVEAGRADRQDAIVSVALDLQQALWHAGSDGRFHPLSLEVFEVDEGGAPARQAPAQAEGGAVTWVAQGGLAAGEKRRYRVGFDSEDSPAMQSLGKPVFKDRVILTDLGKELLVSQNTTELARYRYREVWKPFFSPVCGAHGNVARDIEREHPHQHGLYISYGGEDCLGVNIWSEEESLRPPLGPSGRMAHEGFERIEYGWVYGQFAQRLSYVKAGGYPFARELRTVRVYAPSATTRVIDWTLRLEDPADTGHRRVALACRVANSMRVRDLNQKSTDGMMGALRENGGRVENSGGGVGELASRGGKFTWLDFSGPVED